MFNVRAALYAVALRKPCTAPRWEEARYEDRPRIPQCVPCVGLEFLPLRGAWDRLHPLVVVKITGRSGPLSGLPLGGTLESCNALVASLPGCSLMFVCVECFEEVPAVCERFPL